MISTRNTHSFINDNVKRKYSEDKLHLEKRELALGRTLDKYVLSSCEIKHRIKNILKLFSKTC